MFALLTRCTILCACHTKRHLNVQKWSEHALFLTFWLGNVLRAKTARAKTARAFLTSQLPNLVRSLYVLYILTWKRASRHNGVHFFDISTSKSGRNLVCFVFGLEMCFAPQRRAIFHRSSDHLAPSTRFSEPTFRPSRATNHWKNTAKWDFPTFSRTCFFFLLSTFSSLIFSLLLFYSLTLPTSAFPTVHIVGSFTSKLPSTMTFLHTRPQTLVLNSLVPVVLKDMKEPTSLAQWTMLRPWLVRPGKLNPCWLPACMTMVMKRKRVVTVYFQFYCQSTGLVLTLAFGCCTARLQRTDH